MQVEQLERETRFGQHVSFYSPPRADKERIDCGIESLHRPGNRESRIEMPARSTAGKKDSHSQARARENDGSVAREPTTFSRVLPMLTRIPVMRSDNTRLERPKDMNGSVNPVVGSKPMATPM